MHCRRAVEFMTHELDEPLPPLRRAGLTLHLALCSTCRQFRAQMSLLHQAATALMDDAELPARLNALSPGSKEHLNTLIRERLSRET